MYMANTATIPTSTASTQTLFDSAARQFAIASDHRKQARLLSFDGDLDSTRAAKVRLLQAGQASGFADTCITALVDGFDPVDRLHHARMHALARSLVQNGIGFDQFTAIMQTARVFSA